MISVIDVDDVILKTGENKLKYMGKHFSDQEKIRNIKWYQCSRTDLIPIIGEDFYHEVNAFIKSREPTLQTAIVEGVEEGINALLEMGEVYVLSARSPEETAHIKERLEQHKFYKYMQGVYSSKDPLFQAVQGLCGSKKAGIARHLGARLFVDDDPRHMPQQPVDGLHCLLFDVGKNKITESHIPKAHAWNYGQKNIVTYARSLASLITTS